MVAEFASPRPSAAIADDLSQAEISKQRNATSAQLVDRRRVVSQLEALLEGDDLPADSQQDFWTAFQGLMDSLDEDSEAVSHDNRPLNDASQTMTGTLLPLRQRAEASTDSGFAPSKSSAERDCGGGRDAGLADEHGAFSMGQLLPFRARPVELAFDPTPTWAEVMVAFGQEIKRIREGQAVSLDQIRLKTQVPLYHLQALESGAVDRLPEEVFVRGFLKRICGQLGEEGKALLAQMPEPKQEQQEILAPWQQLGANSDSSQVVHLRSAHLYVGYATLLAGAAGGLAWSFQETAQVHSSLDSPQPVVQKSAAKAKLNPAQRVARLAFGSDVAQPEQSAPEMTP